MSGHSKWSTIKHKKAAKDIEKGKVFSKLSRIVTVSVIEGGGIPDPEKNIKLRLAIERAKAANMPKDNIKRAIEKGVGPDKDTLKAVIYEAFATGGVNLLILVTTDNTNRTLNEIRNIIDRGGGKLGSQGSVAYLFKKCGVIVFEKKSNAEDAIYTFADALSSFDLDDDGATITVYIPFENLGKVQDHLEGLQASSQEVYYKPTVYVSVANKDEAQKVLSLVEALEEHDDVNQVFTNFDIPEELLA